MQGSSRGKPRPSELRTYAQTSETSAEDFLFHLYRGSELLQDDRVHQAKEELEAALRLQPRDPKGQDLLAVVYFRLGLYPRAIEIYEELVRAFPTDASLGNNLALCYLKTGQSEKARAVLEQLVMHQPEHVRAWAYLGLAYERLGDYGKAKEAFERGRAPGMARRMAERISEASHGAEGFELEGEIDGRPSEGFEELDDRESILSMAPPAIPEPPLPRASVVPLASLRPPFSQAAAVPSAAELAGTLALTMAEGASLAHESPGTVLVRVTDSFATRLDAVRAMVSREGDLGSEFLPRRSRGKQDGTALGGLVTPIVLLRGAGQLVLGARGEHRLVPMMLEDDIFFVRESLLLGFDGRLTHESLELVGEHGAAVHFVGLRGKGGLVLEAADAIHSIEVARSHGAVVRRDALVGWIGELSAAPLPPHEAPGKAHGLLAMSGEGKVLLASRSGGLLA